MKTKIRRRLGPRLPDGTRRSQFTVKMFDPASGGYRPVHTYASKEEAVAAIVNLRQKLRKARTAVAAAKAA